MRKETKSVNSAKMSVWAKTIFEDKYAHDTKKGRKETWEEMAIRVSRHVLGAVKADKSLVHETARYISERKFVPGGRYLYASGLVYHQTNNCFLFRAEDSREGWAELVQKITLSLMTGGGVGVDYSDLREEGAPIRKTRGVSSGPLALMEIVNEAGRWLRQGGNRRSAIWAGLSWKHPDILKFIRLKDWISEVRALKEKDFNFPASMDGTNISVQLDDEFFDAIGSKKHDKNSHAQAVYWETVERMLKTAEPGFSVDCGKNAGETLRNACTEVTSADDSDVCNLGSVNLARIESLEEMNRVVEVGTAFLLAGTVYSMVPYPRIDTVRTKNRRLGLGVMGVHEWLLMHGKKYGPDEELSKYMEIYAGNDKDAAKYAKQWKLSVPKKCRAIAPNGTIGIVAETTTGIEPIFCAAYKRRYLDARTWRFQYVIDPTAKRLIEEKGIKPDAIEDAYTLAENVERRVEFQAWMQQYVDHGISSTINLPDWGSPQNNKEKVREFGEMLLKYLPKLRGITVYPNGARSGQPLVPVKYETASKQIGDVFEEAANVCNITKGGSCGE